TANPVRAVAAEATVGSPPGRAAAARAGGAVGVAARRAKAAAHRSRFSRFSRASRSPAARSRRTLPVTVATVETGKRDKRGARRACRQDRGSARGGPAAQGAPGQEATADKAAREASRSGLATWARRQRSTVRSSPKRALTRASRSELPAQAAHAGCGVLRRRTARDRPVPSVPRDSPASRQPWRQSRETPDRYGSDARRVLADVGACRR